MQDNRDTKSIFKLIQFDYKAKSEYVIVVIFYGMSNSNIPFFILNNDLLKYSNNELKSFLCPKTTMQAWTFSGKHIREAIEGKRILNPSIDLSNKCNLNCPYCYIEKIGTLRKKKDPLEYDLKQYKEIIKRLYEAGAKTINIIGAGEPIIDRNFISIVTYVKRLGLNVLVATNGIMLAKSNSLISFLYEHQVSIVLKVNSFNVKLQDLLVGRKGYSVHRNSALKKLINQGFNLSKPTMLGINTLLMKSNTGEIFDIFKFCRENNLAFIAGNYMPTGRTESSLFNGGYLLRDIEMKSLFEKIPTADYILIRQKIKEYDRENHFPVNVPDAYISGLPCIQGLGIQVDNVGNIWHCPTRQQIKDKKLVSKVLGKIAEDDFVQLWGENEYLKEFRSLYSGLCPYKSI